MKTFKQFFFLGALLFYTVSLHGMEKENHKLIEELKEHLKTVHKTPRLKLTNKKPNSSQSCDTLPIVELTNQKQQQLQPNPKKLNHAQSTIFFKKKNKVEKEKKEKKSPKTTPLHRLGKQKSSQSHDLLPGTLLQSPKPQSNLLQQTTTRPRSTSLPHTPLPPKKIAVTIISPKIVKKLTLSNDEKEIFSIIKAGNMTKFEQKKKNLTTFTFQDHRTGNTPLVVAALTISNYAQQIEKYAQQIKELKQKKDGVGALLITLVSDETRTHDLNTKNKDGKTVFSVLDDVDSEQKLLEQVIQLSSLTLTQASLDKKDAENKQKPVIKLDDLTSAQAGLDEKKRESN